MKMHTLPPSGVHLSTKFASRGLTSIPITHSTLDRLCWLNVGVEEFPSIIQLNIVRTTTLCQREANNIQGISFGFLDQFVLSPLNDVILPFLIRPVDAGGGHLGAVPPKFLCVPQSLLFREK